MYTKSFDTEIEQIISRSLAEDVGDGDITTDATIPAAATVNGRLVAKADGIVAGLDIVRRVFAQVSTAVFVEPRVEDGDTVTAGDILATVRGPGRAILTGERVALNFLQRMSGIATMTEQFVARIADTEAKILDTRKTVPGLRLLDKWAVKLGGGENHRIGLYDMALIKENHIVAAGGIAEAVERVREHDTRQRPIEVEVTNLDELRQALDRNVDRIMLDNMRLDEMREAVTITAGAVQLEASGNVNLDTVADIAATGVDFISVGALTHSVTALDISLLLT